MGNKNLLKAKRDKNDEFYTQVHVIENELRHYHDKFKGKILYMNTDHPDYSKFYWHFKMLFEVYGLKKIIATFWNPEGETFKTVYDGKDEVRTPLKGDGDFRSDECVAILEESDVVVTNPPFSLFREFVDLLIEKEKEFLIIGTMGVVTNKDFFPHVVDGKIWPGVGFRQAIEFEVPSTEELHSKSARVDSEGRKYLTIQAITWWTNLDYPKRHEDLLLWASYKGSENHYPEYDNYKAINVDKVAEIPYDYEGVMGVPVSFIGHWNPSQFEIIGYDYDVQQGKLDWLKKDDWDGPYSKGYIDGKRKYDRILIRNLNPVDEITI